MTTSFTNKINILSELWMNYRDDDELEDFIDYNDIGLPLAYMLANDIALPNQDSDLYINETFDLLLAALVVEDTGFENLDQLLTNSKM